MPAYINDNKKPHPRPEWRIFRILRILNTEDIDDVISRFFMVVLCEKVVCLYNKRKSARWLEDFFFRAKTDVLPAPWAPSFLPLENKIQIFTPSCNIPYIEDY